MYAAKLSAISKFNIYIYIYIYIYMHQTNWDEEITQFLYIYVLEFFYCRYCININTKKFSCAVMNNLVNTVLGKCYKYQLCLRYCITALTDWAIKPWVQLTLRSSFVQLLQFHGLFSVTFHFSCLPLSVATFIFIDAFCRKSYGIHHWQILWSSYRKLA